MVTMILPWDIRMVALMSASSPVDFVSKFKPIQLGLESLEIVDALESNGLGQASRLGNEFLTSLVIESVAGVVVPIRTPLFLVGATDVEEGIEAILDCVECTLLGSALALCR
jgi:hypothetical protein